jgi:hypothetical protein
LQLNSCGESSGAVPVVASQKLESACLASRTAGGSPPPNDDQEVDLPARRTLFNAGAATMIAIAATGAMAAPASAAPETVSGGYYASPQNCDSAGAWIARQQGYRSWFCRFEPHDPPWHLYLQ